MRLTTDHLLDVASAVCLGGLIYCVDQGYQPVVASAGIVLVLAVYMARQRGRA